MTKRLKRASSPTTPVSSCSTPLLHDGRKMANTGSATTIVFGFLALAAFIAKVILNYLSGKGQDPFPRSNSNVSDYYYLEITPAGWAFSIWGLIYTLNGGYILYALSTLFRVFPAVFTTPFFVACIASDAFNVAWLFAFSYLEIGWSCGAIINYQFCLYAVLAVLYRNYQLHQKEIETRYGKDAWVIRIVAQNGAMMNATWVTIASLLNIAMVIVYKWEASQTLSCNLVLSILLVEVLVWFVLENLVIKNYLNFTYTDWPVVLWALSSSLAKNWDPEKTSSRFALALLVISALLFIARIVLQAVRNKTHSYNTAPQRF